MRSLKHNVDLRVEKKITQRAQKKSSVLTVDTKGRHDQRKVLVPTKTII